MYSLANLPCDVATTIHPIIRFTVQTRVMFKYISLFYFFYKAYSHTTAWPAGLFMNAVEGECAAKKKKKTKDNNLSNARYMSAC